MATQLSTAATYTAIMLKLRCRTQVCTNYAVMSLLVSTRCIPVHHQKTDGIQRSTDKVSNANQQTTTCLMRDSTSTQSQRPLFMNSIRSNTTKSTILTTSSSNRITCTSHTSWKWLKTIFLILLN